MIERYVTLTHGIYGVELFVRRLDFLEESDRELSQFFPILHPRSALPTSCNSFCRRVRAEDVFGKEVKTRSINISNRQFHDSSLVLNLPSLAFGYVTVFRSLQITLLQTCDNSRFFL